MPGRCAGRLLTGPLLAGSRPTVHSDALAGGGGRVEVRGGEEGEQKVYVQGLKGQGQLDGQRAGAERERGDARQCEARGEAAVAAAAAA